MVFDLRYLNSFVRDMSLSMETLKRLRLLAKPGDYMVSFDIQDGFYHVALHPEERKFLAGTAIANGGATGTQNLGCNGPPARGGRPVLTSCIATRSIPTK